MVRAMYDNVGVCKVGFGGPVRGWGDMGLGKGVKRR